MSTTAPNPATAGTCDLGAAREFLAALDPTAKDFIFQAFDDVRGRKNRTLTRVLIGTLDEHAAQLDRLNARGAGIFVTINATGKDDKGRTKPRAKENINRVRAVWHEQDDPAVEPMFPALPPSCVVESSPGRHHRYWFSNELGLEDHNRIMTTMVRSYGSDKNAADLSRVLRLPGFYHSKNPDKRHLVKVIGGAEWLAGFDLGAPAKRYGRDQILSVFGEAPKQQQESKPAEPPRGLGAFDRAKWFQLLGFIAADERKVWLEVGMALHYESSGNSDGIDLWKAWSPNAPEKFDEGDLERTWRSFDNRSSKPVTGGTIYHYAMQWGWKPRSTSRPEDVFEEPAGSGVAPDMTILNRHTMPAPRFPIEIFGELRRWMERLAEQQNCPIDYVGATVLSVAATAIGHTRKVRAWQGFVQPCILWNAITGEVSQKKTGQMTVGLNVCERIEADLALKTSPQFRAYEQAKYIATSARKTWEKAVDEALRTGKRINELPPRPEAAEEPSEPPLPRLRIGEVTTEKVMEMVSAQRRGLLWARQELAGLLGGLNQYRGGKGNDRQMLLEAYDGGSLPRDRMNASTKVESLHLNLLGGLQPDKLDGMLLSGDDDGLFARTACYWPDRVPLKVPKSDVADSDHLYRVASRLIALDFDAEGKPVVVPLDDAARAIFEHWYMGQEQRVMAATGLYAGALGKRQGLVLRLSLVLEHIRWSNGTELNPPKVVAADAVKAAIRLCDDYFDGMLIRVLDGAALSDAERAGRVLAGAIDKYRPEIIDTREIKYRKRVKGLPANKVDMAVSHLVERGWLFKIEKPEDAKAYGGRPGGKYSVNPEVLIRLKPDPGK